MSKDTFCQRMSRATDTFSETVVQSYLLVKDVQSYLLVKDVQSYLLY